MGIEGLWQPGDTCHISSEQELQDEGSMNTNKKGNFKPQVPRSSGTLNRVISFPSFWIMTGKKRSPFPHHHFDILKQCLEVFLVFDFLLQDCKDDVISDRVLVFGLF